MAGKDRVVVAMSGGVDSSVAAALLLEQGYLVSGIMLKLWSDEVTCAENSCCPPEAIEQATRVAGILGIPFYVMDFKELFKKTIVDEFIDAYRKGITPNPCYFCNRNIRWGFLLDRILDTGAELLATGHYARVSQADGIWYLQKGIDPDKDQSYVLSGLDQRQLAHSLFPLGNLKKTDVRELARKLSLPVAEKHDSQDLCFIGESGYRDFLVRHSPAAFIPGDIRLSDGRVIGRHTGLANYTIGQRKGLGAGFPEPIFVLDKDVAANEVIAGYANELGKNEFFATLQSLSPSADLTSPLLCEVKTRYKSQLIGAVVEKNSEDGVVVRLNKMQRDVTPGQIAVFYQNDTVIGSAVIKSFGIAE